MKRLRVDDTTTTITTTTATPTTIIKEITGSSPVATVTLFNQSLSTTPVLTYNNTTSNTITNIKIVSEGGMQSGLYTPAPVSYGAMPAAAAVPHSGKSTPMQPLSVSGGGGHSQLRTTGSSPPNAASLQEMQSQQQQQQPTQQQSPGGNFQRLKVEDALSYLDLVKFKFGSKPQVYNDFLDIMKEFKSQSIDTPGVIQRVSNLFKGFPELIVGFNTFLPPGYKIEVQKSDQGYAFQVSVSMPSPTGNMPSDPQQQKMIMRGSGTINVSGSVPIQSIQPCQPLPLTQQHVPQQQQPPPPPPPTVVTVAAVAPPQPTPPPPPLPPPPAVPVVHHSSNYGSGAPIYNNSLALATTQVAAVSQALQGHTADAPQNQPVQFNHAINYVNKIKNRFQDQPEKYKRFLDILHIYQKEQRTMKESSAGSGPGSGKHLTEQEVYSQVAKLFENQSDLLAEFGQFLPDATNHMNQQPITSGRNDSSSGVSGVVAITGGGGAGGGGSSVGVVGGIGNSGTISNNIGNSVSCGSGSVVVGVGIGGSVASSGGVDHASVVKKPPTKPPYNRDNMMDRHLTHKPSHLSGHLKRSPTYPALMHRDGGPPPKKHKLSSCKDVTLAEAGKYGTLNDYAFFDKVRKALRTQEVYNNFLRCLILFNQEIISKSELIMIVTPFLGKFPELMRWFREFLGQNNDIESIPYNVTRSERPQGEQQLEIDLATAKRLGASYCVIPPSQEGLTCSGRTQLCKEVLNDQWVSFPTWSEDSTFVSSRKTQYEEYMYRCEDERFELDVVIETNASTIRVLEGVAKKLNRMNADEVSKFRLDDCLGGSSPTLHQRALKRIYGDKANEIIEGLKRNPAVAVPVVLRRLKTKEEEWREAQKGFNKLWREQNEKYYLKSLDHQGINFKQTDVKALRSKSLFNEIETIFDERHEQNEEGAEPIIGPHLIIPYKDRTILDDAANLLIHHVKRQTGIQKGEKRRIKHLLRQFIPELFFHPKQQLTDDERDDDDDKEDGDESPSSSPNANITKTKVVGSGGGGGEASPGKSPARYDGEIDIKPDLDVRDDDINVPLHAQTNDPDEAYTLFMGNNNWYIFLRLHAILCERLAKIYERAVTLAAEEAKNRSKHKESTAIALRLKPKPQIEIEDYYVAFLDMIKNLLDNNMDANTYEDTLREMFGIHAYVAFTLDKVVSNAVRQLQHCVTERTAIACTDLFNKEQKHSATGGQCSTAHRRQHSEFAYQRAAEKAVQDENCFKIYIYRKDCRLTIELMDTDSDDTKKVDETKKWSNYKECYADCTNVDNKRHSPVYLNRNLRIYKKRMGNGNNNNNNNNNNHKDKKNTTANNSNNNSNESSDNQDNDDDNNKRQSTEGNDDAKKRRNSGGSGDDDNNDKRYELLDEFERKLERPLPDRDQTEHSGYEVADDTQCKFNSQDSKIMYAVNKDSYLYKISAFYKARKSHPTITKRLSSKFRAWLKRWASENISDVQHKQCIDWLMGRGDGVIPNRTRVLTDNDLTRTPYVPYNRYRVERLNEDTT